MPKKAQPWSGRFAQPVDEQVKRFTASVSFDRRLAKHDIAASLAHARMLAARGILAKKDLAAHLAMTPETLSRLLRRWQDAGWIDVDGSTVAIRSPEALLGLADAAGESA